VSDTEAHVVSATPPEDQPVQQSPFKQILTIKAVHLMAFYILVYVGVEVTIGG
jgi:fucose permease